MTPGHSVHPGKRTSSLTLAFAAGLLFAAGLGISGMGRPAKVLAFLDVTGDWDPSLLFVMAGAIGVHMMFALRAKAPRAPRFASTFVLPAKQSIDGAIFAGSAMFGAGWGLAGYCPGPAVLAVATGQATSVAFFAAMIAGMWLERAIASSLTKRSSRRHDGGESEPVVPPDVPSTA